MKTALTIAGFDPSGGAGLQQDLKVFNAFGVYGMSAVAALTAQNSSGVASVEAVDSKFLKKQLEVLISDIVPDATKVGMLFSAGNVSAVASFLKKYRLKNIVLDPVIMSSSGMMLVEESVPELIRKKIFPLCTVITPNIREASVLSGIEITGIRDMAKAAVVLKGFGPEQVIITGGHLTGSAVDMRYDGTFSYLKGRRAPGTYHGTGCAFSSALAALLAAGNDVPEAAHIAKRFMGRSFRKSVSPGKGMRLFSL
ncbi:MAG: bifunctional hydroxymethylpyrimidine kinase/phosphomethylpyrimidine kinase [Nitrospirae bacterium]|nr:bifunctional hydroxymethylpyrimidine kinase/phosphomethylpyrimidine kinase [Nitrospirota bacterium]